MKNLILLPFIILLWYTCANAQTDIAGSWKGIVTQDEGSYRSEYEFEIYLNQKGNLVTGRSYIQVDDLFCEMKLVGSFNDGMTLKIKEIEMVNSIEKEGMEWCFKTIDLLLIKQNPQWKFEGRWKGFSSEKSCIPGNMVLKKVIPRA